ncbi:hypothetical protein TNCV_3514931 [Trichonephila clavipes]|nr:hypothetical protein TNCV_3514931 [Trichonephila clavipes]
MEPGMEEVTAPGTIREDHSTWYWGCGGAGFLRNNYPGVNQKDPHRASVIESREVCSQRKGSADGTINGPSREPCPENSKHI